MTNVRADEANDIALLLFGLKTMQDMEKEWSNMVKLRMMWSESTVMSLRLEVTLELQPGSNAPNHPHPPSPLANLPSLFSYTIVTTVCH